MKIVCDACQAKYSISDDKVQGKVFKIRCKKCSNIIVVRGGANAAEAAPPPQQDKETHVYDYGYDGNQAPQGDESVWHVVINQDQIGPMTAGEVGQRFAAGEIDAESYIWREGFTDWLPLSQVDTFAQLASGGGAAAAHANGGGHGGHDAVSSMFGGGGGGNEDAGTMRSDPGDLFAAASASSHASNRGDDDSGDLFGGGQGANGGQAAAQGGANSKLRGERNENSVLFSLNNLAQLASDKPAANPGVTSMPSGHATGAAGGEGSGLIDIRSMASAYLGSQGAGAGGKATTASIGTIDDLPVFGGTGFSEPAVIVPTAQRGGNNKILYAMIGAVGLLAVAAVIMVVVLLGGKNTGADAKVNTVADNGDKKTDTSGTTTNGAGSNTVAADGTKPTTPTTDTSATNSPTTTTPPPTTGTGSGGSAQQVAVNDKTPPKTNTPPTTPAKTPPHTDTSHVTTPPKTNTTTTTTTPPKTDTKTPPATTADAGGCDEVSCLLGTASGPCCTKFKKGGGGGTTTPAKTPPATTTTPPASSGGGDLPETLDRDMISNGIGAVAGSARSCGGKFSSAKGKVKVHVKVAPGGNISGVDVSETPDPGLGNCVAGAVSHAHFAKTQKGGSFSYPFVF